MKKTVKCSAATCLNTMALTMDLIAKLRVAYLKPGNLIDAEGESLVVS